MSYQEIIAREVKKINKCFLNWPVTRKVRLGDYFTYDGRSANYDWRGNLADCGINLEEIAGDGSQDELYSSSGSASISFDVRPATPASAELKFRQKSAFVLQSCGGRVKRLSLDPLTRLMLAKITSRELDWHPAYIVVTEVQEADSFSTFVSGSNDAETKVVASLATATLPFNLANARLDVAVAWEKHMSYVAVAQKSTFPYFIGHRLATSWGRQYLKRYGVD